MERLGRNIRKILLALYDIAPAEIYAVEIGERAGVVSGSLYPALRELRQDGLVETVWRPHDDDPEGQPLRYYKLSANGHALARALSSGTIRGANWRQFIPVVEGGTA